MDTQNLLRDTTKPYKVVDYNGIEYTACKDFDHISRYRRLRQVIHYLDGNQRFTTLETQNDYDYSNIACEYYTVPTNRENRLDLISYDFYNTTDYKWVIAYVNEIHDGFTVYEGQLLLIPLTITDLFGGDCILSSIPATSLNLGTE